MMDVSFEDISATIAIWNIMYAEMEGSMSHDVHGITKALDIIGRAEWQEVVTGPLRGARYFWCQFGVVVQQPQPSNQMSLIASSIASAMGIPST